MMKTGLTYGDVTLVPKYSDLGGRSEEYIDISTEILGRKLKTPIISSPMDTVTELAMMIAMKNAGGLGVHHRYCPWDTIIRAADYGPVAVSPSMGVDFLKKLRNNYLEPVEIVIDVAHGDSKHALDYAYEAVKLGLKVVSGNIVTWQAAQRYSVMGVNTFRVGVGGGSSCSTRVVAGVGVPQLTAIMEIYETIPHGDCCIIADGGIETSGDVVKALAAGASAVMCGRLLAGADEAPGERKTIARLSSNNWITPQKAYRGMASRQSLLSNGKSNDEIIVEGVSSWVDCTGPVANTIKELANGIRAGFAYLGAHNVEELRQRAEFIQVTNAGYREGTPRI